MCERMGQANNDNDKELEPIENETRTSIVDKINGRTFLSVPKRRINLCQQTERTAVI